ncbi:hypothetical protein SALBM311S_02469 [Streptomyces alboniger]
MPLVPANRSANTKPGTRWIAGRLLASDTLPKRRWSTVPLASAREMLISLPESTDCSRSSTGSAARTIRPSGSKSSRKGRSDWSGDRPRDRQRCQEPRIDVRTPFSTGSPCKNRSRKRAGPMPSAARPSAIGSPSDRTTLRLSHTRDNHIS